MILHEFGGKGAKFQRRAVNGGKERGERETKALLFKTTQYT